MPCKRPCPTQHDPDKLRGEHDSAGLLVGHQLNSTYWDRTYTRRGSLARALAELLFVVVLVLAPSIQAPQ